MDWSFEKGFGNVKLKDKDMVMHSIMGVFNITTRAGWLNRLHGKFEPRVSEARDIERIFKVYGVSKKDVWGKMEEKE